MSSILARSIIYASQQTTVDLLTARWAVADLYGAMPSASVSGDSERTEKQQIGDTCSNVIAATSEIIR